MAWLQSSFTNHQLLKNGEGNQNRRGYKVASSYSDLDKSETPLLYDAPLFSPEKDDSDWLKSAVTPKKQNTPQGKTSFLSTSFFDRSGSAKTKSQDGPHQVIQKTTEMKGKPMEDKKLLNNDCKAPDMRDDDEDESDDDWSIPHTSGGYQKVRSGAD